MPNTVGHITPISSADGAASSEEVRALITVLWELAANQSKTNDLLTRVLSMFDHQANDPRYKDKSTWRP